MKCSSGAIKLFKNASFDCSKILTFNSAQLTQTNCSRKSVILKTNRHMDNFRANGDSALFGPCGIKIIQILF